MNDKFVVIMAGGRGERFWPQSRLKKPKHLLPIVGNKSMLGQTVDRLQGIVPIENVLIITNQEQRDSVLEVCPELLPENVIGEPVGRDTAAAVGLAMMLVKSRNPNAIFAMLPADHVIHDSDGFKKVMEAGFATAEKDAVLVTIGIEPTGPATGYGYIHKGDVLAEENSLTVYKVQRFVEKPDLATAESYIASKEYFWNAGMFIWSVSTIESAFEKSVPSLYQSLQVIEQAISSGDAIDAVLEKEYPGLEKISVDYAIMEKADNVVTMPSAFDWDDVGEWPAIARHFDKDGEGNVTNGSSALHEASNNIIVSPDGHLTALVGVDDLIVVHTEDATLVCPKSKAQDIKQLVKKITADSNWNKLT